MFSIPKVSSVNIKVRRYFELECFRRDRTPIGNFSKCARWLSDSLLHPHFRVFSRGSFKALQFPKAYEVLSHLEFRARFSINLPVFYCRRSICLASFFSFVTFLFLNFVRFFNSDSFLPSHYSLTLRAVDLYYSLERLVNFLFVVLCFFNVIFVPVSHFTFFF